MARQRLAIHVPISLRVAVEPRIPDKQSVQYEFQFCENCCEEVIQIIRTIEAQNVADRISPNYLGVIHSPSCFRR